MGGGTENILGETLVDVPNFILAILQMGKVSPTWDHTPGTLQREDLNPNPYGCKACTLFIILKILSLCTCFQNSSSLLSQMSLHMFL